MQRRSTSFSGDLCEGQGDRKSWSLAFGRSSAISCATSALERQPEASKRSCLAGMRRKSRVEGRGIVAAGWAQLAHTNWPQSARSPAITGMRIMTHAPTCEARERNPMCSISGAGARLARSLLDTSACHLPASKHDGVRFVLESLMPIRIRQSVGLATRTGCARTTRPPSESA